MTAFILALLLSPAFAAPPSSTLSGPQGTLSWEVREEGGQVHMHGSSPRWTVDHVANPDLTPVRTVHTSPEGEVTTIEYTATGAVVKIGGKEIRHDRADLWDADTLDVRLGARVAAGKPEFVMSGIDTGSGKVYQFDAQKVGDEQCGGTPCTHMLVQLTGLLRWVGPSWNYWYAADGRLLKFEGPAGTFAAPEVK